MDKVVAGFGEVMLRLSPGGKKRFSQALPGTLEATFGGAEANVCASLAMLGGKSRYLTSLPGNPVGRACAAELAGLGVDISAIVFTEKGRMGVYYAEHGSNMRGSAVVYDRAGSVISELAPEAYNFELMLNGVDHLHLSGITPALSENAFKTTLALAEYAEKSGVAISIDLNFRKKLWNWSPGVAQRELARRCMRQIVRLADVIIGNEEDASDVFGIKSEGSAPVSGKLNTSGYREVATRMSAEFPKAQYIAITLRESVSADHNNWGGLLYDCAAGKIYYAPVGPTGDYAPYELRDIVDRFGGGDSFCAGLLFALYTKELADPERMIRFAVASSALKHTISGDYNRVSRAEVESLMGGVASGRVSR